LPGRADEMTALERDFEAAPTYFATVTARDAIVLEKAPSRA